MSNHGVSHFDEIGYAVFNTGLSFSGLLLMLRSSFKTTIVCGIEMRIPSATKTFRGLLQQITSERDRSQGIGAPDIK